MARRPVIHWTLEDLTGCPMCTRLWKRMVETAKRFPHAFGTSFSELLAHADDRDRKAEAGTKRDTQDRRGFRRKRASRETVSVHLKNLLAWGVATHALPEVAKAAGPPRMVHSKLYGPCWRAYKDDIWILTPHGAEPVWVETPPDSRKETRSARAEEIFPFLSEKSRLRALVAHTFAAVHDRGASRLTRYGRVVVSGSRFPEDVLRGFVERTGPRKTTSREQARRYERLREGDLKRLMRFAARHDADVLVIFPDDSAPAFLPPSPAKPAF